MQIILAELEKQLFPEYYPYFEKHFYKEKAFLKQYQGKDKITFKNIDFVLKVNKLCYSLNNHEVRRIVYYFYKRIIDDFYYWQKSYDWKELKAILMIFVLFSDVKDIRCLKKKVNKPMVGKIMKKYLPGVEVKESDKG